jgi:hypothetical protein
VRKTDIEGAMRFKVTTRLSDIFFSETFDTELEALAQAKAWTKAKLGEVVISCNGVTYTLEEFTAKIDE